MLLRSRVVYKYTCQCCSALYLGQTRRHFYTGISEHMEISPLTDKKLATSSLSATMAHSHKASHIVSYSDFSVISPCRPSSNLELFIRESLLISKFKPALNENISSFPLSYSDLHLYRMSVNTFHLVAFSIGLPFN